MLLFLFRDKSGNSGGGYFHLFRGGNIRGSVADYCDLRTSVSEQKLRNFGVEVVVLGEEQIHSTDIVAAFACFLRRLFGLLFF